MGKGKGMGLYIGRELNLMPGAILTVFICIIFILYHIYLILPMREPGTI